MTESKAREPLVLNDLLINNVNSWGNVNYNIPLRVTCNETRTSTNVAHRFIPPIPCAVNYEDKTPLPNYGIDRVVEQETYKTTSSEYCVKPNSNKVMEKADCAINCRRVNYMTSFDKRLQSKILSKSPLISVMKDDYRGVTKVAAAPPDAAIKPPDPDYIFDVVAAGRNEARSIPEDSSGFHKELDPYMTTYKNFHKPFSVDDLYSVGAKDQITYYTENPTPKARGFGPRLKEIWMPLKSKVYRSVYDRIHVKKEYKEVAAAHNPINNIKGVFVSEMKMKYKVPYTVSTLATWGNEEVFDAPPFPPNPFQTNIAPFMYCSDYCHISQGTQPSSTIDQVAHPMKPHTPCKERIIVSRDY